VLDRSLQEYATRKFERDGVKVMPNSSVTAVGDGWLEIKGQPRGALGPRRPPPRALQLTAFLDAPVPYGLLVWSTGLSPNPFVEKLGGVSKHEKTKSCVCGRIWLVYTKPRC
jgi:NADH dehydrogenase